MTHKSPFSLFFDTHLRLEIAADESTSQRDVNVDGNVAETDGEGKSPAGFSNEGDKNYHKIDDQHNQQQSENNDDDDDDDDDEETCGFCKYMKGGGCRDAFVVSETTTAAYAVARRCRGWCRSTIRFYQPWTISMRSP